MIPQSKMVAKGLIKAWKSKRQLPKRAAAGDAQAKKMVRWNYAAKNFLPKTTILARHCWLPRARMPKICFKSASRSVTPTYQKRVLFIVFRRLPPGCSRPLCAKIPAFVRWKRLLRYIIRYARHFGFLLGSGKTALRAASFQVKMLAYALAIWKTPYRPQHPSTRGLAASSLRTHFGTSYIMVLDFTGIRTRKVWKLT